MIKLKDRKGEMKDMCDETVIKFVTPSTSKFRNGQDRSLQSTL